MGIFGTKKEETGIDYTDPEMIAIYGDWFGVHENFNSWLVQVAGDVDVDVLKFLSANGAPSKVLDRFINERTKEIVVKYKTPTEAWAAFRVDTLELKKSGKLSDPARPTGGEGLSKEDVLAAAKATAALLKRGTPKEEVQLGAFECGMKVDDTNLGEKLAQVKELFQESLKKAGLETEVRVGNLRRATPEEADEIERALGEVEKEKKVVH